jgi:tRNA modification GTPase
MDYFRRLEFPVAAAATARGGPLVVFRVSGKNLESLRLALGITLEEERFAKYCNIFDIDQGLVVFFKGPKSFTGEDVMEFHVHGSDRICESLLGEFKKREILEALPGEFSFRSVINNKMTLAEAESLHVALGSASESRLASGLVNLSEFAQKNTNKIFAELETTLTSARGRLESAIDFSEATEEQSADVASADEKLTALSQRLDEFLTTYENFSFSLREPRVLIVGEPNAGKSSLMNLLVGAERSLVSKNPGTTRDYIEAKIKLRSQNFVFVDTAGIRNFDDSASDFENPSIYIDKNSDQHSEIERQGIDRALSMISDAHAILWVKDSTKKENEKTNLNFKKILERHPFVVELKSFGDQSKNPDALDLRSDVKKLRNFLEEKIAKKFHVEQSSFDQGKTIDGQENGVSRANIEYFLSERQVVLLRQLLDAVKNASRALSENRPLELVAEDLKAADKALKNCQGKNLSNDYISEIFSQFCLGK